MSNVDKAAIVTKTRTIIGREILGKTASQGALDAAEALADAGLLMPDLPKMEKCYGTAQNDWVYIDDERALWIWYLVDDSPLTPNEAYDLALSLLAATNYVEEK